MFGKLLQSLVNFICGNADQQPQQQSQKPPRPHTKPSQQGKPHKQSSPPQSHQQPAHPHKPISPKPHNGEPHQDLNQINQHNPHYTSLRAQASEEGNKMSRCFDEAHKTYESGDGARAKELSNQGKEHQRRMEQLNAEACDWIFAKNNEDSKPGEVDLHGLYVKEAISRTDQAIERAKSRGDREIHLIVGKGLHSPGGAAKLKPAIEDLMRKHRLVAELDPHNSGVLIVEIGPDGGRGVDPEEVVRRLERNDEACVIM